MVSSKYKPTNPIKPGRWLGFFFWTVLAIGAAVILLECPWLLGAKELDKRTFGFDAAKWLAFLGGWGAILAAITTARVMLNNAIKQHTMTTLLEMRMSEAYMSRSKSVGKRFYSDEGIYVITKDVVERNAPEDVLIDVTYLLNYYEFIASAIRYGNLDETLMKESLRGMVCNTYELSREFIDFRRKRSATPNLMLYEHLGWLYLRWYIGKYKRKALSRLDRIGRS